MPNNMNIVAESRLDDVNSPPFQDYGEKRWGADFTAGDGKYGKGLYAYFDRSKPPDLTSFGYPIRKGGKAFYPWGYTGKEGPSIVDATVIIDQIGNLDFQKGLAKNSYWFAPFSLYGVDPQDPFRAVAVATVNIEKTNNDKMITSLYPIRLDGNSNSSQRVDNAPFIQMASPYRYRVYIAQDGQIFLFLAVVNGDGKAGDFELVEYARLDKSHVKPTIRGGFLGVYGTDRVQSAQVFISNLTVKIP